MGYEESKIEGRNAVLEAFRSGKTIDKLYVLDGCQDGPVPSRERRESTTPSSIMWQKNVSIRFQRQENTRV